MDFLRQMEGTPDMTLNAFYDLYRKDMDKKLRNTTKLNKANMIESKILPYLGEKKLAEITPLDILGWQNAIQDERTPNGLHYRDSYLRSISNQLSAMLNHAVRYYNPPSNPMSKVDRMGSRKTDEMKFWIKEEYKAFSREMMDKDASLLLFELLYWLGIRSGEALALMPQDFDFKRNRVSTTKTYVRLNGKDVFNLPKTKKSVRTIVMPQFLADEVQDYLIAHPLIKPDGRLANATKSFLTHEIERGCKQAGVKRIRIHDLRHSHVSLLIEGLMGDGLGFLCASPKTGKSWLAMDISICVSTGTPLWGHKTQRGCRPPHSSGRHIREAQEAPVAHHGRGRGQPVLRNQSRNTRKRPA